MNKAHFRKLVAVLLILVTSLTCCFAVSCKSTEESENINSYEYTSDTFAYSEQFNSAYKIYNVNKTTTDYAIYYFDYDITKLNCDRFVTYVQQLFENLQAGSLPEKLIFFVSNDIKTPRAESENNTVYFSASDIKSVELINYVLQALNTNTLNYGLLYGISSQIFVDLKWGEIELLQDAEIADFFTKAENRGILDLTYPVFNQKFFSAEQIKYAKSISIKLVDYIEKTHGKPAIEQLFAADLTFDMTFDNLFCGYLNEYLDKLNVEKVQVGSEVLRCVPYTSKFPYKLFTASGEYYMDYNWVERNLQTTCTYKNFKFNYADVKNILLNAETSYRLIREFFDYSEDNRFPILFQNLGIYEGFAFVDHFIISSLLALTHEYAHIISFNKLGGTPSWMREGIAIYLNDLFGEYASNECYIAYTDREAYEEVRGKLSPRGVKITENYMQKSTNENYALRYSEGLIYYYVFEDGTNLHDAFDRLAESDGNFTESFSDFLVKTYGKQKYLELYRNDGDTSQVYGKSQAELIDEYIDYLYNIFN